MYPPAAVLEGEGTTQRMIARAKYSDGTDRDISHLAVFLTNNDNSAPIDADGLVTAAARGEAFVMARYETHTVGNQILTLPASLEYTPPEEQAVNYVDELVGAKLQKLRIEPSELCSDEVFLRRVTIDITGRLPTPEEYEEFTSYDDPNKRSAWIDRLLERKEFSEIWAMKWAELLMIRSSNRVSYKSAFLYSNWLTEQIANEVPLDEMVKELLGASGGTFKNPATNYYQIEPATLKVAENVAQVFMGIRTQCAQCHNHPFDRWTMDDYYSFAAFFAQIGRKRGEDYRETIVFNSGGGEVKHLVGGRVMAPKFLGGPAPDLAGKDRRVVLAEWLASPENPYFATSVANRVWAHFFGVGIVEPVDDIRVSNPPSNPELFEALGAKLTEYNYDFKQLVRDICNSNTYQRTTRRNASNDHDELNFAHSRVRRIKSEMLLDCVSQVTETKDKFRGLPLGARAVQIADGGTSNYFLNTFGRANRTTVCTCDVKTEPTLSQSLHLINGGTVQSKMNGGGVLKRLLEQSESPREVIEALYVRCLCRKPTPEELDRLSAIVAEAPDPTQGTEDVFLGVVELARVSVQPLIRDVARSASAAPNVVRWREEWPTCGDSMMKTRRPLTDPWNLTCLALCLAAAVVGASPANVLAAEDAKSPEAPKKITYEEHVKPILRDNCFLCHNQDDAENDLALDSYARAMEGGAGGAAIVPGDPGASRLWKLVSHEESPGMPPKTTGCPTNCWPSFEPGSPAEHSKTPAPSRPSLKNLRCRSRRLRLPESRKARPRCLSGFHANRYYTHRAGWP